MYWKCPLDALLPSALREIASKVFFLWPNCLAGEAAFFGQRTKTLSAGFPCFNGLGCFLPCPGHTQFLLEGRWRGPRAGSPGCRAPAQRPALNEPRTTNRRACAAASGRICPRRIDLRFKLRLYLAAMPPKRKISSKQAEALANSRNNRHVAKAVPAVSEVEQQPTKKKRGPQLGSTYRTEVNQPWCRSLRNNSPQQTMHIHRFVQNFASSGPSISSWQKGRVVQADPEQPAAAAALNQTTSHCLAIEFR